MVTALSPSPPPSGARASPSRPGAWLGLPALAWLGWAALFYGYCGRVYVALGRRPISINEHAGLQGGWHNWLIWVSGIGLWYLTLVFSAVVVLGVVVRPEIRRDRSGAGDRAPIVGLRVAWPGGRRRGWAALAVAAAWIVPVCLLLEVDPGGWLQWFLD